MKTNAFSCASCIIGVLTHIETFSCVHIVALVWYFNEN